MEPTEHALTPRQLEVLLLAGDGLTAAEIAARLGIAQNTAKTHLNAVKLLTGARHKRELVMVARAYAQNV